jgi:site-specific recombinase XerD
MPKVLHVRNIGVPVVPSCPRSGPVAGGRAPVALMPLRRRVLIVGSDLSLTHALDRVHDTWQSMASHGEFTEQTLDKFELLLGRFGRYAHLRGAVVLDDITPDLAEDFITAPGRSRHGHVTEAAAATMRLRRSVVRAAYRTLRELKLSDADPTRDIELPARAVGGVRPLSEDEVIDLRHHSSHVTRPSRHGAAAALALAGGHSGEIGHIRVKDLDVTGRRVWMHGSTKTDPRWCPLDDWGLNVLTSRAAFVTARRLRPESAPHTRLAVSDRHASDASLQARACVALADLLKRIGLGGEEDVKPASVTAWAAVAEFERTGRIEDAARLLGLRSLDRTAAVIGYSWRAKADAESELGADCA